MNNSDTNHFHVRRKNETKRIEISLIFAVHIVRPFDTTSLSLLRSIRIPSVRSD